MFSDFDNQNNCNYYQESYFINNSFDEEQHNNENILLDFCNENYILNEKPVNFYEEFENYDYQKNMTMREGEDEKFNCEFLDPNEPIKRECVTEIPKSLQKTRDTDSKSNKGEKKFLEKKRENLREINEEEEESNSKEKNEYKKIKSGSIFEIFKECKKEVEKGRKKKFNMGGKHNKFSPDNIIRKIKTNLFDVVLRFINNSMEPVEIENPKKNSKKKLYSKPFLLKINKDIIKNTNVDLNINLLNSKLKEIFSNDVSKKVENHGLDKNKKLIEKIYKEKIQIKTIPILEMTLLQCLEQFRGSKKYKELSGLEDEFDRVIKELKLKDESDDYIENFTNLVNTFEIFYSNKRPRKPKKKEEKTIE